MDYRSVLNTCHITDLNGNNINSSNDNLFIILHTYNPSYILNKINIAACNRSDSIWQFNEKLPYVLKRYNLDPNNYSSLGNIWFSKTIPKDITLLLVNNKITKRPDNYKKVTKFGDGFIWKPIAPSGYVSLGLVYSKNKPTELVATVKKEHTIETKHKKVTDLTMNEYHYLGHVSETPVTIKNKKTWPKGKFVVLVEPDEPWYIKKQKQPGSPILVNHNIMNHNTYVSNNAEYKVNDQALYKTNFTIDNDDPNVGYGYSFNKRLHGEGCKCNKKEQTDEVIYEMFEDDKNSQLKKRLNIVTFAIIILILLIFIYKNCKKYNFQPY